MAMAVGTQHGIPIESGDLTTEALRSQRGKKWTSGRSVFHVIRACINVSNGQHNRAVRDLPTSEMLRASVPASIV